MINGWGLGNSDSSGFENKMISLITSDYSWEQVIYDLIAAEGLDPWDLDLNALSGMFMKYLNKAKELDFRMPAKYVIISSMILRMKSDHLRLLDIPGQIEENFSGEVEFETPNAEASSNGEVGIQISGIPLPNRRKPVRKVTVADLISSLKKAMATQDRRDARTKEIREKVKISTENISKKIETIYQKINSMLSNIKEDELKFSNLVEDWNRKNIVDNFLPLIHLDHQKKIECKQENMFDEIFIKKSNGESV